MRSRTDVPECVEGRWVRCPRCRADEPVTVLQSEDRLLGLPGTFQVVRCQRCGFLYTNPQPGDDDLTRHYPDGYCGSPSARRRVTDGGVRALLRSAVLASRGYPVHLPRPHPVWRGIGRVAARIFTGRFLWVPTFAADGTLVDVGCGTGGYLAEMRDLGWRVVGVEPNPCAAREARDRFGLDVLGGTLESAALPSGCADVVVMRMVLEHVRDPRETLDEVRRILEPGGRLLLSVPNAASVEATLFGSYWFAWELPRHLSHFTPASLTTLLDDVGFGSVRVRHLVNGNNMAASIGYLRRRRGPAPVWLSRLLLPVASLMALVRQSGRIWLTCRKGAAR